MRIPRDNPSEFLDRIAPFVETDGARNFNAICRELSIPYQTLRFRLDRLYEQGISIIPIVDVDKLGLQKIRASFRFTQDIQNHKPFFGGLYQQAGLKSYTRNLLSHEINCEFLIPNEKLSEFGKLLRALEEMKLIRDVEFEPVLWKEVLMMKTQYFDYSNGQWDVDYSQLKGDPSRRVPKPSLPDKFDRCDLLILKSLEQDPWIKIVDLAKKLEMPVGDVSYHLNKHVMTRKLISTFRLRWIGTKEAWLKHSIVGQSFTFEKLSENEARHAMSVMTSTPFIWNHLRTEEGTYLAELFVPVNYFAETQAYLSEKLRPLDLSPKTSLMDWSFSSRFTIPYSMYEKSEGWQLNAEYALSYILQMIKEYESS